MEELNHFLMNKSSLSQIEGVVQQQLLRCFPDTKSPQFIIAVSGGVDSVCLLHVFHQLNIEAVVAHVNYQKRGSASDKDAQLVKNLSQELSFECKCIEVDPQEAEGQNFQQWAREVRYRFFRDLVAKHNADGIAVAHHRDDQVETVLQKIFRGAGLASWSGMDVWDGELFRPLLHISRKNIEAYAKEKNIPYRTDESNLESDFARNFLRNEWTKKLSEFFPGWQDNILRVGEEAQNYQHALGWIVDHIVDSSGIDKTAFDDLEPGLQRGLVLYLLKRKDPTLYISQQNLQRIRELPNLQTGKKVELTSYLSIIRDRNYYVIEKEEKAQFDPRKINQSDLEQTELALNNITLSIDPFNDQDLSQGLYLDVDAIAWPITLRRWKAGDRLQPLGMEGHQTVAEHLTNRKVSAVEKKHVLVIESFEETICALIFPPIKNQSSTGTISELAKCDSNTQKCLRIKYSA